MSLRNQKCRCGSGRKFKNCCMKETPVGNGELVPKKIKGQIIIVIEESGDVNAQATGTDAIGTMQALGIAMAKLALVYRHQEQQKVQVAPPGIELARIGG